MADLTEAEALAAQGKKIHAIKELRSRTGLGLKEAKDAVEHFMDHRQWPHHLRTPAASEPSSAPTHDELGAVEQLVAKGKVIHAIKELRSLTRWGLKDSKEAVDRFRASGAWPGRLLAALGATSQSTAAASTPAQVSGIRGELERLVTSRKKIAAIKELRIQTGWGLREAKDAVEHFEHHGTWRPDVLTALETPVQSTPSTSAATTARQSPVPAADADPMLDTLARHLGSTPTVRLAVPAQRANQEGQLVMLDDRACFVRPDGASWAVELQVPYDQVSHVETHAGPHTNLYVSYGHQHERFELDAADADAALALFRVFAR